MEAGKRVRVIAEIYFFVGQKGTITAMPTPEQQSIMVQLDGGKEWPFDADELEVLSE